MARRLTVGDLESSKDRDERSEDFEGHFSEEDVDD